MYATDHRHWAMPQVASALAVTDCTSNIQLVRKKSIYCISTSRYPNPQLTWPFGSTKFMFFDGLRKGRSIPVRMRGMYI